MRYGWDEQNGPRHHPVRGLHSNGTELNNSAGQLHQDIETKATSADEKPTKKYKHRKFRLPADMRHIYLPPMENPILALDQDSKRSLVEDYARENELPLEVAETKLERQLDQEFNYLSQIHFPLPPRMSMAEWKRLLGLTSSLFRFQYLEELARRVEEEGDSEVKEDQFYEELLLQDKLQIENNVLAPHALNVDSYTDEIAMEGISTTEASRRLAFVATVADRMVSAKRWLPPLPPERQRDRRELIREATSEQNAFKVLNFLSKNFMKTMVGNYVMERAKDTRKKTRKKMVLAKKKELEEDGGGLFYGAFTNSIMLRVNKCRMEK